MKTSIVLLAIFITACTIAASAQDTWLQQADFGGPARYSAVGFSIGNKGYVGTGVKKVGNTKPATKDIWEYDPATNAWAQKADFGGNERSGAVGFSIGAKGYIGTGVYGSNKKDFWEYDPATNAWTQKADFGGTARYAAVGFSIGNKGYIGTGSSTSGVAKDFWQYDPLTDNWTQKTDFGGLPRWLAVGFSIDSFGYIGTGYNGVNYNDFWQYDPVADSWTQKANFAGPGRWVAVGFSIGHLGYIGTGQSGCCTHFYNDFWQYSPVYDTWTQKANFGGHIRQFAVGIAIGNKGYIGLGYDSTDLYYNDWWAYTPESCDSLQIFADADGDGYGNANDSYFSTDCNVPAGYVLNNADCNDNNDLVNPGVTEVCGNSIDDNCNGVADEVLYPVVYADEDHDGYGNLSNSLVNDQCAIPDGYVNDSSDCDDTNANIHPNNMEICNGLDDDCDGAVDEVITENAKLYLPFNGNANDESGYGHDGIVYNAGLTTDRFGSANSAYNFSNAAGAHIDIADNTDLRFQSLTMACWYYSTNIPTGIQHLTAKSLCPGSFESYGLYFVNGQLKAGWSNGVNQYELTVTPPAAGQWHHVAFTFDDVNDTAKLYVDGVLKATKPFSYSLAYDTSPFTVGADLENCALNYFFNGKIDDLYLFDGALSAAEILLLYQDPYFILSNVEICNGMDDDCDGIIDDGFYYYADNDADGFGDPAIYVQSCSPIEGYVDNGDDCNDNDASIHPGAPEVIGNGIDDNCNGLVDEGCQLPTGLTVSQVTQTSVKLTWTAANGANHYKLHYKVFKTDNWMNVNRVFSTSQTINGLTPGTKYACEIKSVCSKFPRITSDWGLKVFFTTNPLKFAPQQENTFEVNPNPVENTATISFFTAEDAHVLIELYDMVGRKIRTVADENVASGNHSAQLVCNSLNPGLYLVQMRTTGASLPDEVSVMMKKIVITR